MRKTAFLSAWIFIVTAAACDGYFAWHYRDSFATWEMNPLARWTHEHGGLGLVLAIKTLAMTFATGLAFFCRCNRHRLEMPFTVVIGAFYLLLSLHYVAGYVAPVDAITVDTAMASNLSR